MKNFFINILLNNNKLIITLYIINLLKFQFKYTLTQNKKKKKKKKKKKRLPYLILISVIKIILKNIIKIK